MDTSWIRLPNDHVDYVDGCLKFLELARECLVEGKTKCPCKSCKLRYWLTIDEVHGHILFKGFYQKYTNWIWHTKTDILDHLNEVATENSSDEHFIGCDDMKGLLEASSLVKNPHSLGGLGECSEQKDKDIEFSYGERSGHETTIDNDTDLQSEHESTKPSKPDTVKEEAKYKRLHDAATEELYEGCQTFSKLSFLLHLFHIKCMFHWSSESFNKLIELLLEAFPQIQEFPSSYYEGKKIINSLGLGYEKIHACPKNCMLYWEEFSEEVECHVCHTSRWKKDKGQIGEMKSKDKEKQTKGEGAKVMIYFPFIPRLERIYMSPKTAKDMLWHHNDRVKDGKIRHPADAIAWKKFDSLYPTFASDPRNVRFGLASDGFNPYRLMNTTHSTWPVILIPYNLPPWLCMKSSSFILSCIIPGKSGPGMDIDVYLQPLLKELKMLWEGVHAFDACEQKGFTLRAALHSTINDFPAYAMLSGWSTSGYNACPRCTHSTCSGRFGGKICFSGHRKWLPLDHPYRSQGSLFDGTTEYGSAPVSTSGSDVTNQVQREQLFVKENDNSIWSNIGRSKYRKSTN